MKRELLFVRMATFVAMIMGALFPAYAQQITGTLGSPSATTTIDGKQLPPPDLNLVG